MVICLQIYILRKVYDYWEFFYVDEQGNCNEVVKSFEIEISIIVTTFEKIGLKN